MTPNRKSRFFRWTLLLILVIAPVLSFGENYMPPGFESLRLGMSLSDLLSARPNIQRKGMVGEEIKLDAKKLVLFERFPQGSEYQAATYYLENGQLQAIGLTVYPAPGKEQEIRKALIKRHRALWGKETRRKIPEDGIRKGNPLPVLVWERDGFEYILTLPTNREKGDSKIIPGALQIRRASTKATPLVDMSMSADQQGKFWKGHDVDDQDTR